MTDTVIKLIGPPVRVQDSTGVWRTTAATETEVFAQINSVNRAEFFAGGQQGMKPEHQFTVFAGEYTGQQVCEYNGVRYAIYRSYLVPGTDYIELYAQRETGVHTSTEVSGNDP